MKRCKPETRKTHEKVMLIAAELGACKKRAHASRTEPYVSKAVFT